MKYSINNLSTFKTESFHDFAVSKINCNYENHTVEIPLLSRSRSCLFFFSDVKGLSISIEEPWGEGIYIADILCKKAINKSENLFDFVVLVNSGDRIAISCTAFEVKQYQ